MDDQQNKRTISGKPVKDDQKNSSFTPVSSGKEQMDMAVADRVAKEEGDEYWENFSREIELEKEVIEMGGVEKIENGEVPIPEKIAQEMGVKPVTHIQTPIEKATGFSIRGVMLDDSQLTAGLAKPTSSGFRWLVEWFIYQLLKAKFSVRKIKGRLQRGQRVKGKENKEKHDDI